VSIGLRRPLLPPHSGLKRRDCDQPGRVHLHSRSLIPAPLPECCFAVFFASRVIAIEGSDEDWGKHAFAAWLVAFGGRLFAEKEVLDIFNQKYGFSGHLWQARFHSCVLDEDRF
jgi:hypothetical protein